MQMGPPQQSLKQVPVEMVVTVEEEATAEEVAMVEAVVTAVMAAIYFLAIHRQSSLICI
jgi:hypothetical protein